MNASYSSCLTARIRSVAVQIEAGTSGSGVIVGDNGNEYLIATSRHVVSSINTGEEADILWNGRKVGSIGKPNIWLSNDYDLALIRLNSKEVLPSAPLPDTSLSLMGKPIIIAGYPVDSDIVSKDGRSLRVSIGTVAAESTASSSQDGYSIGYTAPTTG